MNLIKEFYCKLDTDRIKINWNKNLIPMDKFLSFLKVDTERSRGHLGSDTGWTLLTNKDIALKVKGGIVNGVEYLDNIEYGKNLHNPYNNYVNPFFLFDILSDEGKAFFVKYYENDIEKIVSASSSKIALLKQQLLNQKVFHDNLMVEISALREQPH